MKEVEILVKVFDDKDKVLGILNKFESRGVKKTLDIYYFDKLRDNLQVKDHKFPVEWFRLRKKGDRNYITYKKDVFEGKIWLYSHEDETKIENLEVGQNIITNLGLEELVRVDNTKYIFEIDDYEIVLEEVKDLGLFLEVEVLNFDESLSVKKVKQEIFDFIEFLNLNISEELNQGKPEMLLEKKLKI